MLVYRIENEMLNKAADSLELLLPAQLQDVSLTHRCSDQRVLRTSLINESIKKTVCLLGVFFFLDD